MIVFIKRRHLLRFFPPDWSLCQICPQLTDGGKVDVPTVTFHSSPNLINQRQRCKKSEIKLAKLIKWHCYIVVGTFYPSLKCLFRCCYLRCCCHFIQQVQSNPRYGKFVLVIFGVQLQGVLGGCLINKLENFHAILVSNPTTAIKTKSLQGLSAPPVIWTEIKVMLA